MRLRQARRKRLKRQKKEQTQKYRKDEILESLTGSHDFDIPESMLERELTAMVHEAKTLKKSDKDEAALRDELKPDAAKNVRAMILLSIIGEKEGVNVTDEELKEKILELSQQLSMTP